MKGCGACSENPGPGKYQLKQNWNKPKVGISVTKAQRRTSVYFEGTTINNIVGPGTYNPDFADSLVSGKYQNAIIPR